MRNSLWWEHSSRNKLIETFKLVLIFLVLFTIPLNLFYTVSLDQAYIQGLRIDYLIPKLYVFAIPLFALLLLEFHTLRTLRTPGYLCLLILLLFSRQLASTVAPAALSHLLYVGLSIATFLIIREDPLFARIKAKNFIYGALLAALIFQTILALYQFIEQKSLLSYQFFGESQIQRLVNITHGQFFFGERILPYGSTPHPNILAGLVTIFSILLIMKTRRQPLLVGLLGLNNLLIIYLTQSLSALLTLGLFGVYILLRRSQKYSQIIVWGLFYLFLMLSPYLLTKIEPIWPHQESISRRIMLTQASFELIRQQLLLGVGLTNFTAHLETIDSLQSNEIVRFVQPVHHTVLLMWSEGGLLLLLILGILLSQAKIYHLNHKIMILLAIMSLDHYLFSQAVGLQLVAIYLALME